MKTVTRSFYELAAQRTIEHIARRLDDALGIEALAGGAGLSPFHFHRVFRGMVGETPLELARRLRMERAAWRLAHARDDVITIAFDAGYETHEGFTRAFRACYGTSPSGFRQRKYRRIELAATCGVHYNERGHVPAFTPRDSGGKTMNVEIVSIRGLRVGTVRHVGPYNQIPQAFARLGAIAARHGVIQQPGTAMIAIYHDDPETVPPDQLRSDAAIVLPDHVPMPDGLAEQRIPAGVYARVTHIGPYELLGDTWARLLGEWLPASGRRLASGVSYELYRNTPGDVPVDKLHTEIYVPIED